MDRSVADRAVERLSKSIENLTESLLILEKGCASAEFEYFRREIGRVIVLIDERLNQKIWDAFPDLDRLRDKS